MVQRFTYRFLWVFLLAMRVLPQVPLLVEVLHDLGAVLHVRLAHRLVRRDAIDGPHTLLQLAVHDRA